MRERIVGVVGRRRSALQEALTLADAVASHRPASRRRALGAGGLSRPVLEHPKIEVRYSTVVEEVLGDTRHADAHPRLATGDVAISSWPRCSSTSGLTPNTTWLGDLLDSTRRAGPDRCLDAHRVAGCSRPAPCAGSLGRAASAAGEGAAAAGRRPVLDGGAGRGIDAGGRGRASNGGSHG